MGPLAPVVLIIAHNESLARFCYSVLSQSAFHYTIKVATDWQTATVWTSHRPPSLILLESNLFVAHRQGVKSHVLSATPKPALIVVDQDENVDAAIAAFSSGAIGYVSIQPHRLQATTQLSRAAEWALRRAGHLPCRGRILVVDDSLEMLETLSDILQIEGFKVFTARSAALAETLYRQELVHLAVIDVRLEREHDASDTSGLELARRIDPVVPCVIMTSHPSVDGVRWAWREIGAVDYVIKPKGELDELLDAITDAFERQVRINWQLQIDWGQRLSLKALVGMLKDYYKTPSDTQARAAVELDELLRKLFGPPIDRIEVRYMSPGRGGSGVVLVLPYLNGLEAEPVVIKFGRRDDMERERRHYEQFVLPFAGRFCTQLRDQMASTLSFAGLKFSFVGLGKDTLRDLNTFYNDPTVSVVDLCRTVQTLFEENCRLWYQGKQRWVSGGEAALAQAYEAQLNLDRPSKHEKLRTCITALLDGRWAGGVRLSPLRGVAFAVEMDIRGNVRRLVLPHPLLLLEGRLPFPHPTYTCITHGDLNGRNVFVDETGRSWLIDFFKSGWGPVSRDLAEMESVVKFELLETEDLRVLLAFERAILRPTRFDQAFSFDAQTGPFKFELQRALAVIATLRRLAQRLGDVWSTAEYDVGLFYYALKALTQRGITPQEQARYPVRARHALISAGLICEKLAQSQGHLPEGQRG